MIDDYVEKLFNYLFNDPSDLLEHVTAVDKIDSTKRKAQPSVEAIYLLQPNVSNINRINNDFESSPAKYRAGHVRFLPGMNSKLNDLYNRKVYIQRYISSTAILQIAFYPKEFQMFQTMGIDKPLQLFFNKQCTDLIAKTVEKTINSLLNICIITGEYPIVRFKSAPENEIQLTKAVTLAEKVAVEFQAAIDNYARANENFPPPSDRPRAILLITDRTLDLFSPILHDFSYQAMAYDLVPTINLKTNVYKYSAENEKGEKEEKSTRLMDIYDADWVELKHRHIIDAQAELSAKLQKIIDANPLLVDRSKVKNTTDLLTVVAHLKGFDEDRRRLVLHKTLIEECLSINQTRSLAEWADAEQTLACFGVDVNGNKVPNITETIFPSLLSKNSSITDKVRYIITYALYRGGIIEEDFIKLLAFAGIDKSHEHFPNFMTLMKNFDSLGFKLIKDSPKAKPFQREWFHDIITNDPNVYNTSRYIPAVGNLVSKLIANPLYLNEDDFPYVKDKPIQLLDEENIMFSGTASAMSSTSLRNQHHKAAWTKSSTNAASNQPRQRIIYYIMGGVTYGEIKAAYDQSNLKNKDVFIGSDSIITPLMFMQSVERLSSERAKLQLMDDITVNNRSAQNSRPDMSTANGSSFRPSNVPVNAPSQRPMNYYQSSSRSHQQFQPVQQLQAPKPSPQLQSSQSTQGIPISSQQRQQRPAQLRVSASDYPLHSQQQNGTRYRQDQQQMNNGGYSQQQSQQLNNMGYSQNQQQLDNMGYSQNYQQNENIGYSQEQQMNTMNYLQGQQLASGYVPNQQMPSGYPQNQPMNGFNGRVSQELELQQGEPTGIYSGPNGIIQADGTSMFENHGDEGKTKKKKHIRLKKILRRNKDK